MNEGKKREGNVRHGFVYRIVPHITLKSIANNKEIDAIWEKHEKALLPLLGRLSEIVFAKAVLEEWEVPRDLPDRQLANRCRASFSAVLETTHRPAKGNRRFHRQSSELRMPLRQTLHRWKHCARDRLFYCGKICFRIA